MRGKREDSREKREERRGNSAERSEKRETNTIKIRWLKYAMARSQNGGMVQKNVRPLRGKGEETRERERREKKEERREKGEERDTLDQDERVEEGNGSVPEWRDGTEKVRPLRDNRE